MQQQQQRQGQAPWSAFDGRGPYLPEFKRRNDHVALPLAHKVQQDDQRQHEQAQQTQRHEKGHWSTSRSWRYGSTARSSDMSVNRRAYATLRASHSRASLSHHASTAAVCSSRADPWALTTSRAPVSLSTSSTSP